jgi:hypothetical protein
MLVTRFLDLHAVLSVCCYIGVVCSDTASSGCSRFITL